jgi:hypothetical protein
MNSTDMKKIAIFSNFVFTITLKCRIAGDGGITHLIERHLLYNPDDAEYSAFQKQTKYLMIITKYCFLHVLPMSKFIEVLQKLLD